MGFGADRIRRFDRVEEEMKRWSSFPTVGFFYFYLETGSLCWRDRKLIKLTREACWGSVASDHSDFRASAVEWKGMWGEDLLGLKTSGEKKEGSPELPPGFTEICWWRDRTGQLKINRTIVNVKKNAQGQKTKPNQ